MLVEPKKPEFRGSIGAKVEAGAIQRAAMVENPGRSAFARGELYFADNCTLQSVAAAVLVVDGTADGRQVVGTGSRRAQASPSGGEARKVQSDKTV